MNSKSKNPLAVIALFLLFSTSSFSQDSKLLEGRWDLTMTVNGKERPSWLEVRHSGEHALVGRFCYVAGSARPVSEIKFNQGKFSFVIPSQWKGEEGEYSYLELDGSVKGDSLKGTIHLVWNNTWLKFVGSRAPALHNTNPTIWDKPVALFNSKDLTGWHATGTNQWIVESEILKSSVKGTNLVTDKTFNDFKLHIEFRCPKNGNSGIYLRGRYELQITDNKGMEPSDTFFGGIYGFVEPNQMVAKSAGEWQSYDVTLIGRRVTIVANGIAIVTDQVIPGITGGALDSKEGEPGPIMLQGDHEPIEFRNIILTPAINK